MSNFVFFCYNFVMEYKFITDKNTLEDICGLLASENIISLDTETSIGITPAKLSLIQISTRSDNFIIDALAVNDISPLKPILESPKILKIIHFADFEKGVLSPLGINITNIYDTCIESRKLRKLEEGGHSLKAVCKRELGIDLDKSFQSSDWMTRPLSKEQLEYAAMDSYVLLKIYDIFNSLPPEAPPPF